MILSSPHKFIVFKESQAKAVNLLLEQNLRSPFAEHLVTAIVVPENCAHGLPYRVEGVDFEELLFRKLVANVLVVSSKVEAESQQSTFGLVSNLAGQPTFPLWRLQT